MSNTISNETPVFFYFKQDYGYRGLDETMFGQFTFEELTKYKQLVDYNTKNEFIQELCAKYNLPIEFEYSINEMFCVTDNLIEQLIEHKIVSCFDDIGYESLSLISIDHAKKEVSRMFIEQEF